VPTFYERPGLNIETYDLRANPGDVDFFVQQALGSGGPVLELACGTGRISWAIAAAGVRITGLDRSPEMLRVAESKRQAAGAAATERARFVSGDMTAFDLGQRFPLIICPFRSFQMLLTVEEERDCLGAVYRHLEGGGRFIVPLFDPRLEYLVPGGVAARTSMRIGEPVRHPVTGNDVVVDAMERENDPLTQTFVERWRFREMGAGGRVLREEWETLPMRWIYRYEMRYLLELSGFDVEAEYSDYEGAPPAYGREQIWVARRRG